VSLTKKLVKSTGEFFELYYKLIGLHYSCLIVSEFFGTVQKH
jgi:hypothetical protein